MKPENATKQAMLVSHVSFVGATMHIELSNIADNFPI
jgi:hypothetical protein